MPAQLALERGMACGFGACFGCVVPPREAATCASASTARCSTPRGSTPALVAGAGALMRLLRHRPRRTRSINGSGTFDAIAARRAFGDELLERFPFSAFVSKTITLEPRAGNPPPRLYETPAGLINSIGLPNKGLDGYLSTDLPQLAELPVPLITNVMGSTPEEVARAGRARRPARGGRRARAQRLLPERQDGARHRRRPGRAGRLRRAVRPLTAKPLIVKLTPNTADVAVVAQAAEAAGADAVSLINTLRAKALDPACPAAWLGGGTGGQSGPAVRAVALAQVAAVAARVEIPIVGMGGIASGPPRAPVPRAGATLVAVGTESFRDPLAGARIRAELGEPAANSEVLQSLTRGSAVAHLPKTAGNGR